MTDIASLWVVTPPEAPDWQTLGAILVGFFSLAGAVFAALRTAKSSKEANAVTFSRDLMNRVGTLEDDRDNDRAEIDKLRVAQRETDHKLQETLGILSVAVEFIGDLYSWGRRGGGEPEPTIPRRLRDWVGHLIHTEGA